MSQVKLCPRGLGISPRSALYAARLALAKQDLGSNADPSASAEDIARRLGFVNLRNFARHYAREHGETPGETIKKSPAGTGCLTGDRREEFSKTEVEILLHHINESLGNGLSVHELARVTGRSRQAFTSLFKKAFGTSPGQYIIAERLKWARWLLTHTEDSIAAVALETGFASQSHLTTALRQHDGLTPGRLRSKTFGYLGHKKRA